MKDSKTFDVPDLHCGECCFLFTYVLKYVDCINTLVGSGVFVYDLAHDVRIKNNIDVFDDNGNICVSYKLADGNRLVYIEGNQLCSEYTISMVDDVFSNIKFSWYMFDVTRKKFHKLHV